MESKRFTMKSTDETLQFAENLATYLQPGDVITLDGQLGAGKTTFTKGLAKGLGVKRNVNSPTFTIIKHYNGRLPLYHMDVYRLEDSDEDIGFDEYFHGDGVSVIEWAQFIEMYLPEARLEIKIHYKDEEEREIECTGLGERYKELMNEISR